MILRIGVESGGGLDRDESRYSLITLIFRSYRSNEFVVVLEKDRTRSG